MIDSKQIVCPYCNALNRVSVEQVHEECLCSECHQPLLPGEPLELTVGNFDSHVGDSDLPVLVDFWAPWCGPCRMMTPVIHAAAKELKTAMRVAKLNTESEGEIAARFGIRTIPTLIVFLGGKIVGLRSGVTDLASLLKWAKSAVK